MPQSWVRPRAMAEILISIGNGVAMQAHGGEPGVDSVLEVRKG